jgi:hypothetical protein
MPPKGPVPPSSVANVGNSIQFHEYFADDLSAEQTAFMARSQLLNAADNFGKVRQAVFNLRRDLGVERARDDSVSLQTTKLLD